MFKQQDIVKNLCNRTIYDAICYIKRDYLELRYIKEEKKIDIFYQRSIKRTEDRIINLLQAHNKNYGILINDNIIFKSLNNVYWRICVVDDYHNFINNINYWGMYIALIEKNNDEEKVLSFNYYLPFLDEYFYCSEDKGCFLDDRKLSLENISKSVISYGTNKLTQRILGSQILAIMYTACNRINLSVLKKGDPFISGLSKLIMKETRGVISFLEQKIVIGNTGAIK